MTESSEMLHEVFSEGVSTYFYTGIQEKTRGNREGGMITAERNKQIMQQEGAPTCQMNSEPSPDSLRHKVK